MTVSIFITLLTSFATATGLLTEFCKKILDDKEVKFSNNLLASIVGVIVGTGGTACYYLFSNIAFTTQNVVAMILMGIATAVGAMVGYDKVAQLIEQFKK